MTTPWTSIHIADGAANSFQFTREASGKVQFVYRPITKAESSSGMYDGGPPRKEELAPDDPRLTELFALLQKLEADKANHSPDRNKGTGAISWVDSAGPHSFIVQMGVADLNALLALLRRFGA
jgi:hypothetical protein